MKEKLTNQDRADRVYDALVSLNEIVEDAKSKVTAKEIKGMETLMSRVTFLKEYCTIHVQTSRGAGHTSTIFEFIEDEELTAIYFTSNLQYCKSVKENFPTGKTILSTWREANKVSFKGVDAIFMDPATHACKKAMHCVYDRAAEQMAITGKAPTIYLIS
jgi:hypothetical protein